MRVSKQRLEELESKRNNLSDMIEKDVENFINEAADKQFDIEDMLFQQRGYVANGYCIDLSPLIVKYPKYCSGEIFSKTLQFLEENGYSILQKSNPSDLSKIKNIEEFYNSLIFIGKDCIYFMHESLKECKQEDEEE